jgi:CheY-like chemotaxis protein
MNPTPRALVLLLSTDLATSSKVAGAGARQRVQISTVSSAATIAEKAAADNYALAIIDLSTPSLDVGEAVAQLRALPNPPGKIIAFGPHVHEALLDRANAAGCDLVLSRGQFHARLDELLADLG